MIGTLGLEVELAKDNINVRGNNFLTVKETLTRIGIPNKDNNTISQTCHILSRAGKYHIMHYKELLIMDDNLVEYTSTDVKRRDAIAQLLESWDMLRVIDYIKTENKPLCGTNLKIIKHSEKDDWKTLQHYTITRDVNL